MAYGKPPNLRVEQQRWAAGDEFVVGIDEVGRGAWAGPLTIGAAVVPRQRRVNGVRDSKMLPESERERLFDRIAEWCVTWGVGHASHAECDQLGMSEAQRLAARRAIDSLGLGPQGPDHVILDGKWDFVGLGPTRTTKLVKADATCLSVAAASILAKVSRDRMMRAVADEFPAYGFEDNKGYPCPRHKATLKGYGPSTIHRRSWVFMDSLPWTGIPRTEPAGSQPSLFDAA